MSEVTQQILDDSLQQLEIVKAKMTHHTEELKRLTHEMLDLSEEIDNYRQVLKSQSN